MRIALYQPDIPQNTGTILRMAACMAIGVDIIEPCGFALDDKRLRRAGMDYLDQVDLNRHISWAAFQKNCTETNNRLVLLTTSGDLPYCDFVFQTDEIRLFFIVIFSPFKKSGSRYQTSSFSKSLSESRFF